MELLQTDMKAKAKRLFDGHLLEFKRSNKGLKDATQLPVAFYKTGPNKYEQINCEGEVLNFNQVLNLITFNRSTDIFYIHNESEISSEETIDRLKLVEAIEQKLKDRPNIQIVSGATGIAITVRPANVVIVFPVVYKLSDKELKEIAEKHLQTSCIGEVSPIAKCNFMDLDKLAAQVRRYKAKGYFVIEDPEL